MPKIYFKNNTNWENVYCSLVFNNDKKDVLLDNETLVVDVPNECEYVIFHNNEFESTDKYLVGKVDIGIEYSYNHKLKKNVTYVYNPNIKDIGHIDTYELEDNINLSYRGGKKIINVFVPANYDKNKKIRITIFLWFTKFI